MVSRFLIASLYLAAKLGATAYTVPAPGGNYHTSTIFSPNGLPTSGDTISMANGATLICELLMVCTVGTSPANDTSTAALTCSSGNSGTAAFINNGQFIYLGTVSLCAADVVFGPGSTTTMDNSASGATTTANYSFTWTAPFTLRMNGTGGGVVVNVAVGSGNSGGFRGHSPASADNGLIVATNVTMSNCGVPTLYCMFVQPTTGTFMLEDVVTTSNSSKSGLGNPGATAVVKIHNSVFCKGGSTDTNGWAFDYGSTVYSVFPNVALTTGTRIISAVFNGGMRIQSTTTSMDLGLNISYSVFYRQEVSNSTDVPLMIIDSGGVLSFAPGNADYVMNYGSSLINANIQGIPGGTLSHWLGLRDRLASFPSGSPLCSGGSSTDHQAYSPTGPVSISNWVIEVFYAGPTGSYNYGIKPLSTPGLTNQWPVSITGVIQPPDCSGTGANFGVASNESTPLWNTCAPNGSTGFCPLVSVTNDTFIARYNGPAATGGIGAEFNLYTGITPWKDIHDNIAWSPTSIVGQLSGDTSQPGAGFFGGGVGVIGYNLEYNITKPPSSTQFTGSSYYGFDSTSAYSVLAGTTVGQGDIVANPGFADASRNLLKYCQILNAADAGWPDCLGHIINQASSAYLPSTFIPAAIAYIEAGYTIANDTTMGLTGGYPGAVVPVSVIASTQSQSQNGNTASTSNTPINAVAASCALVSVVSSSVCTGVLTDNQGGNTYTPVYDVTNVATGAENKVFVTHKPSGGFTSGMTWTYGGTSCLPTIQVLAIAGTSVSANCGVGPSNSSSGTTIPFPFTATPAGPNAIWVSTLAGCQGTNIPAVSVGTQLPSFSCSAGIGYALGLAYGVESGPATAITENWTYGGGTPQVNGGILTITPPGPSAISSHTKSGTSSTSGATIKQ